jgi:8-oxo-dGTP pyrophosphatase MutT (NUDIX family)
VKKRIRPVALALIHNDGKILVEEGRDDVKQETFFRLLGGTIEFGEPGAEAVRRELREELGVDCDVKRLLATLDNIFTYRGKACHEILLVYECSVRDERIYSQLEWEAEESRPKGTIIHRISWRDPDDFRSGRETFYPDALPALLDDLL